MSFKDCIDTAVNAGDMDANRAERARGLYDELEAEYRGGLGPSEGARRAAQDTVEILKLSRSRWRDGTLYIRQSKRGAGVALPVSIVPNILKRLEGALQRSKDLARLYGVTATTVLVCETTGLPWRDDTFRKKFSIVRAAAANKMPTIAHPIDPAINVPFKDLTFDLTRHTAVVRLAEAKCEDETIASITGHAYGSIKQLLERYLVRSSAMAVTAFTQRLEHESAAADENAE